MSSETKQAPPVHTVFSLSEEETLEFAAAFAQRLRGGELVLLEGDLGHGKTAFVRGVARGLELPEEEVTSPSYTLIHEYRGGRLLVYHVDLYRLEGLEELETLGLEELQGPAAVVLVEWGDRLPLSYRNDALTVRLHDIGEGSRRIEVFTRPRETGDDA